MAHLSVEEKRKNWKGTLVCDDFGSYKQSFTQGVVEAGCMAHARRKFF